MNEPMWTTEQAVALCKELKPFLIPCGYHCALGGSVLTKGQSDKDLDIFIYPHKTRDIASIKVIQSHLPEMKSWNRCEHTLYGDDKEVWTADFNGKRIDFFFVK